MSNCSNVRLSAGFMASPGWLSSILRGFLMKAVCPFTLLPFLTANAKYFQQCLYLLSFPYGILPCTCKRCISCKGLMLDANGMLIVFCTCKWELGACWLSCNQKGCISQPDILVRFPLWYEGG